jgi:molybdopterin converting factor small subunit
LAGTVSVKFYGLMRRRVERTGLEVPADGVTVLALLRLAEERAGRTFLDELLDREEGLLAGTIILVNGENVRLKDGLRTRVRAGDKVDLFSPAGGG